MRDTVAEAPGTHPPDQMSGEAQDADADVDAHAVPEHAPRYTGPSLSPSRAADFVQCPLLYRFRVLDRLPEPPSPEAVRGSLVHRVLERLFDLPPEQRDLRAATDLVPATWAEALAEYPQLEEMFGTSEAVAQWLDSAAVLLGRYFSMEDPRRLRPAEREMYVETDLASGLRLRGYVDRLEVAPSGLVRIVDYKTGRAPAEAYEGQALFQMKFYALVLWRTTGVVPTLLQLMYLGDGEVLRYEPTEADLLGTERKAQAIWAAIHLATETGDWRPSPGRRCDWCAHRALCPAWGGTPPPLPGREPAPEPDAPPPVEPVAAG